MRAAGEGPVGSPLQEGDEPGGRGSHPPELGILRGRPPPARRPDLMRLPCELSDQVVRRLLDDAQHRRLVARSWLVEDQAAYPELGEALRGLHIQHGPLALGRWRDAHLDVREGTADRRARPLDALDARASLLEVEREAVPALGEACGAAERFRRVAAEDDLGMRLLHRPGHRLDTRERRESALERRLLHRPEREHRREVLLAPRALLLERDAERVELRLQVANADPE